MQPIFMDILLKEELEQFTPFGLRAPKTFKLFGFPTLRF
jgi:hypothetical protein